MDGRVLPTLSLFAVILAGLVVHVAVVVGTVSAAIVVHVVGIVTRAGRTGLAVSLLDDWKF